MCGNSSEIRKMDFLEFLMWLVILRHKSLLRMDKEYYSDLDVLTSDSYFILSCGGLLVAVKYGS